MYVVNDTPENGEYRRYPQVILDERGDIPIVWFCESGSERDPDEWFAPQFSGGEITVPKRGEHWRITYRRAPHEPWRWKYEHTEQAVRSWAYSELGETLADVGQVQVWNGFEWVEDLVETW